ncbi:OmpA family protein [Candidatus Accumulibacter vicinus]|nr:OmpA family protein [Candidatus Accumulibacter vicinus]
MSGKVVKLWLLNSADCIQRIFAFPTDGAWPMSFPLHPFRCCLPIFLLLSACATVEPPPASGVSGKTHVTQEQPARPPTSSVRQENAKTTPFVDDEARRTVYFSFDGTTIGSEGDEILRQNAMKLKENPQLVVILVGHTDNLGSAAYNLAVADRRTEAVSDRLRALGVARNQIRRQPVGSEKNSKLKCDSEACRRTMRRVELVYEWR